MDAVRWFGRKSTAPAAVDHKGDLDLVASQATSYHVIVPDEYDEYGRTGPFARVSIIGTGGQWRADCAAEALDWYADWFREAADAVRQRADELGVEPERAIK